MMKLNHILFILYCILGATEIWAFCLEKTAPIIIAPSQVTVDQARSIAFRNRPSQKAFDHTIRAGKELELAALAGYLPHIDIQTRIGTVNRSILLPKKQAYIEGRQLLLSFDGPIDRFRIARQETNISYSRKLLDKDYIQFETESAIISLWDTRQKFNYINALETSSETVFSKAQHQNKIGLLDTNVWLKATAQYAQETSQVSQYTDELNIAYANIERSLGVPLSDDFRINQPAIEDFIAKSILASYEHSADYFYQRALNNRKELLELDNQIIRERYVSDSYAKTYLPEVYLFGQVNYYEFKPLRRAQQAGAARASGPANKWVDWRVGLEFDWKFDGWGNVFNSESSHASMLAYQAKYLDKKQQIKKEVYTTYDSLQQALKAIRAEEARFKQADNEFILRKEQHKIGEISDVEMAQAETDLKKAQYDLLSIKNKTTALYRGLLAQSGYPEGLS